MLAKSCQFTTFAIHSGKIHEWCINRFNKADTLQLLKQLEFFHVFWFRIWLNQLVLFLGAISKLIGRIQFMNFIGR